MTLSNFNWTDKTSVRWFILLPTGHEGPYSLESLLNRQAKGSLSLESRIWTEGLAEPVTLKKALAAADPALEPEPELPPLPEEDIPSIPTEETPPYSSDVPPPVSRRKWPVYLVALVLLGGILFFGIYQWIKGQEKFSIRRHERMSLELQQRIETELQFDGWNKPIFFKEYVPKDLSHIWLVTSGFQTCEVEANFQSIKDKLLSFKEEAVAFKTSGELKGHVAEFSRFNFTNGTKIIPGLYEMDVKAKNCSWDGLVPWLANYFRPPEKEYTARMKVILYDKGPRQFNELLETLIRKKLEIEAKNQDQEEIFWTGLNMKFHTLNAIASDIEFHLLDFLKKDARHFEHNLKPMVDTYTKKFGSFLTNFVVSNEDEFKRLAQGDLKGLSQKRNYELMVRMTAKKIGFDSMKIIEEFQALKAPKRAQLIPYEDRIKKTFSAIKEDINQKIIQVSEDRSR